MVYNFDEVVERHNTMSLKWDQEPSADVLPMWVADMDFRTAPEIVDALRRRVDHGVFGYTKPSERYYEAIINWFESRHGWKIERDHILYTIGVVPAVSAVIKALCRKDEKVLVMTPVYNCFFSSIRNNGCQLAAAPLKYSESDGYTIDYETLEAQAAESDVTMLLLCNPHNPSGRVWTVDELKRVGEICQRHGVKIVSDEIHCELTFDGHRYTPMATLFPDCITCVSPSKAFNIAGLQNAIIVCPDAEERAAIDRAININEICDVNPLGITAVIAAYEQGAPWLEALKSYIYENYLTVKRFLQDELPMLTMAPLEGTYLLWIDITALGITSQELSDLIKRHGLHLNPGTMYGPEGEGFIRLNVACPQSLLKEGLRRIKEAVKSI